MTSTATVSSSAEPTGSVLRSTVRLAGLIGCTLAWGAAITLGTVLGWPWRRALRRWILGRWARTVAQVLGVRTVVVGTPPPRPFFLVSNHLSYLDVVVYAAAGPARFVAKSEVRGWPGVGFLAGAAGTIFIDRRVKRDAVRAQGDLAGAVAEGDGLIVFAEATSTAGHTVLPFRPALLEWAARTGHPVHYASIGYRTPAEGPPAALAVCWWGDMTFGRHVVDLCRLPWIEATVRYGGDPIRDDDRKRLAERLHRAVTAQFIPVDAES